MATKIVTKNSSTASAVPTASDLVQGELAVNVADKRLFTEDNGGSIVELGTNPSTLTVTGEITANGGIALGDNDKATFGASDDLQIFHDGSASYIKDLGTGPLAINTNGSEIMLTGQSGSEYMVRAIQDGAVELFYDANKKLATTATGIDVTGTATMDGLTVDGDVNIGTASATSSAKVTIQAQGADGSDETALVLRNYSAAPFSGYVTQEYEVGTTLIAEVSARRINSSNGELIFRTKKSGTISDALKIDSNGDISFYEDTGTTPKMVWDASAEDLQIGGNLLNLSGVSSGTTGARLNANGGGMLRLASGGVDALYVVDGGNVGIGTSSPRVTASVIGLTIGNSTTGGSELVLRENTGNDWRIFNNGFLAFIDDTTERFRIDSSGNVGIGRVPDTVYSGSLQLAFGNGAQLATSTTGNPSLTITDNSYLNASGNNVYKTTNPSTKLEQYNGTLSFSNAASGTAGNTISYTERMRIDSSGNVGIGTSSPFFTTSGRVSLSLNGSNSSILAFGKNGSSQNYILADAGGFTIANTSATLPTTFFNNGAERMRIDSSGNVGIGTSSPSSKLGINAPAPDFTLLQSDAVKYRMGVSNVTNGGVTGSASGDYFARTSGGKMLFSTDDGVTANAVIDSSGRVGIGTSSPARKLVVENDASTSDNSSISIISGNAGFAQLLLGDSDADVRGYLAYKNSDDSLQIGVNNSERMRIDSSGNLLVGATSVGGAGGLSIRPNASTNATQLMFNRANSTSRSYITDFQNNGTTVGTISYTNTSTDYATSSDQRLKENIADADDAGSKVDAIQVRKFDWKADGSHQDYGMIAQELQTVAPEAVSGDADSEEMMGVDYSKLVPMLIKEIQSLRNRVAQLEE